MADWVELPDNKGLFPQRGELVCFRRGREYSEPLRVSHIDPATKTVFFLDPVPQDVRPGDELMSVGSFK